MEAFLSQAWREKSFVLLMVDGVPGTARRTPRRVENMVGPGGVPPHCNSNDLFCPADANAGFETKKQFPKLSSPPEATSLVPYDAVCRASEAHPRPMPGRQEQSEAHGRMPSRRRPRARLLRSDRPAFVYDGRDLYASIVLHADGWHAV